MRLFLPTQHDDIHAKVVARALEQKGHDVVLWYDTDLPQRATVSMSLAQDGTYDIELRGPEGPLDGPFDRVWWRRPTTAVLPEAMHAADLEFANQEWRWLLWGLRHCLAPQAFWVNPLEAALRAEHKALQLAIATQVGLDVPPTLISSDPARIRSFLGSHSGQTIYKAFRTSAWALEDGAAVSYTATVDEDNLPPNAVLSWVPGIYQPRIEKRHELRVTIIGRQLFVVQIDSQAHASSQVDWRAGVEGHTLTPARLEPSLERRCLALMDRLGLVFGCLDFMVTPDGRTVFLEVNQSGQFLWLEEQCPSLPVLDAFCRLLEEGTGLITARRPELRFSDFHDPALDRTIDEAHVRGDHGEAYSDHDDGVSEHESQHLAGNGPSPTRRDHP